MPKFSASESRHVLKKVATVVIFALGFIVACGPGMALLLNPVSSDASRWYFVTSLDRVPLSGQPKEFRVRASKPNSWEHSPTQAVGSLFLRRISGPKKVVALNSVGTWIGCPTMYDEKDHCFRCPCHGEVYDVDGRPVGWNPAPRYLDELQVAVRNNEVFVKWQQFRSVAWAVGSLDRLNSNAYFGAATKNLVQNTIDQLEAGNTDRVLKELRRLRAKYHPSYESRSDYVVLENEYTERVTKDPVIHHPGNPGWERH